MTPTSHPPGVKSHAAWIRHLLVAALLLSVIGGGIAVYRHYRWKRFDVVVPDKVYRSGELSEVALARAIDRLGLRTIVCLYPELAERERRLCQRMGIRFISFEMHSSGSGRPEDYRRVVELMADPEAQPILVHCQAGVARTGAAVALYRMTQQDWDLPRAIKELASYERRGRVEPALREMIDQVSQSIPSYRTAERATAWPR